MSIASFMYYINLKINLRMKKLLFIALAIVALTACEKDKDAPEDNSFNLFAVADDIAMGIELRDTILNDPDNYKIITEDSIPAAYAYLNNIKNKLLTSEVAYDDRFEWEIYIIDDSTVNAFCAPGGYIFFYTGIFRFMENEAMLAGVLAHEMAHAARRHTTDNLTKTGAASTVLSVILGDDPSELAALASNLALGLGGLAFSRENEYEADEFAVRYMTKGSDYDPMALSDFFDMLKALEGNSGSTPTFLSTHPSPDDRAEKIAEHKTIHPNSSGTYKLYKTEYDNFVKLFD